MKFERREYKYLLTLDQYRQLSRYFKSRGLTPDRGRYYVASLYLDTPDYQAYWDKQYGVKLRTKYRWRTYRQKGSAATPVYWEVKKKYGDWFRKNRTKLTWGKAKQELRVKNLMPSVLISYWREAWFDPHLPGLRLTFDFRIEAMPTSDLFHRHRLAAVYPNQYILEIKFSGPVPGYVAEFCRAGNLSRQSLSKYCRSLEVCGIVSEENLT